MSAPRERLLAVLATVEGLGTAEAEAMVDAVAPSAGTKLTRRELLDRATAISDDAQAQILASAALETRPVASEATADTVGRIADAVMQVRGGLEEPSGQAIRAAYDEYTSGYGHIDDMRAALRAAYAIDGLRPATSAEGAQDA